MFALLLSGGTPVSARKAAARRMTVYKSPACGCCSAWLEHVRARGFDIEEINVVDVTPYKKRLGVPPDLASCHTATVNSFAFEGHVPADLIQRVVHESPKGVQGLAVPGMPVGSPGMESGARKEAYDVVLFRHDGRRSIYARR